MPLSLGNRVTEKDIRDWLDINGFVGRTAKINGLELHAIQRPGWVQVFEFHVRAQARFDRLQSTDTEESDTDPAWLEHFGVVLDDERNRTQELRTQIWIFEDSPKQRAKLDSVSEGLLVRNAEKDLLPLLWIGITALIFLAIVAVVSWLLN